LRSPPPCEGLFFLLSPVVRIFFLFSVLGLDRSPFLLGKLFLPLDVLLRRPPNGRSKRSLLSFPEVSFLFPRVQTFFSPPPRDNLIGQDFPTTPCFKAVVMILRYSVSPLRVLLFFLYGGFSLLSSPDSAWSPP